MHVLAIPLNYAITADLGGPVTALRAIIEGNFPLEIGVRQKAWQVVRNGLLD